MKYFRKDKKKPKHTIIPFWGYFLMLVLCFLSIGISFLVNYDKLCSILISVGTGGIASVIVAGIFDYVNTKTIGLKTMMKRNELFRDSSFYIYTFLCSVSHTVQIKNREYYNKEKPWYEWFDLITELYKNINTAENRELGNLRIDSDDLNMLSKSIKSFYTNIISNLKRLNISLKIIIDNKIANLSNDLLSKNEIRVIEMLSAFIDGLILDCDNSEFELFSEALCDIKVRLEEAFKNVPEYNNFINCKINGFQPFNEDEYK